MNKKSNQDTSLNKAPKSIVLAVDLIELLEINKVQTDIAIEALEIVINDFKNKQQIKQL